VNAFIGQARAALQRHPFAADAVLAVIIGVTAIVSVEAEYSEMKMMMPHVARPGTLPTVVSMAAIALPLAWRRIYPNTSGIAVVAAFLYARIVTEVPEVSITFLASMLAIYSVAVHSQRHRIATLLLMLTAILAEVARELFFLGEDMHRFPRGVDFFYNAIVLILPWVLGTAIRSMRARQRELAERAIELQREREENATRAVFAERVRIARELHDVVAHHVSVMGVQAGAARRVMVRQPDKAIEALSSIETSSRQAVSELHQLVGFLRRGDETDDLAPQPGLAQLGDLLDATRAQDALAVTLLVDGERRELSPTLDVSAYRIIQEALTNVRKHSSATTAEVHVHYGLATLKVEVTDHGSTKAHPPSVPGGHGLIGMRERATLHGGELTAGPLDAGGYAVLATFPLAGSTR
jgi:signal transduction histidine kinase